LRFGAARGLHRRAAWRQVPYDGHGQGTVGSTASKACRQASLDMLVAGLPLVDGGCTLAVRCNGIHGAGGERAASDESRRSIRGAGQPEV